MSEWKKNNREALKERQEKVYENSEKKFRIRNGKAS